MTLVINIKVDQPHLLPRYLYIGRGSEWGNPFTHLPLEQTQAQYQVASRAESLVRYRAWVLQQPHLTAQLASLHGRVLGCYCKPQACHGDILAELAAEADGWAGSAYPKTSLQKAEAIQPPLLLPVGLPEAALPVGYLFWKRATLAEMQNQYSAYNPGTPNFFLACCEGIEYVLQDPLLQHQRWAWERLHRELMEQAQQGFAAQYPEPTPEVMVAPEPVLAVQTEFRPGNFLRTAALATQDPQERLKLIYLSQAADLRTDMLACTACRLRGGCRQPVPWQGTFPCDVLVVGEGPGADEDEQGVPFVGRAGQVLDWAFRQSGRDRADFAVMNVVGCRPPGNRDPALDEQQACSGWFRQQFDLIDPLVVIPVGKVALMRVRGFLGLPAGPSITLSRGNVVASKRRAWMIPSWHPSYVLRNGHGSQVEQQLVEDIRHALGVVEVRRQFPGAELVNNHACPVPY